MENINEDPNNEWLQEDLESKTSSSTNLVRIISILFVLGIYLVIFLKILFLE